MARASEIMLKLEGALKDVGNGTFALRVGNVKYATTDVSETPSKAELTTAFGAPATLGSGFVGVLNDNGAGSAEWICWTDGTNWFFTAGTKAS